MRRQLARLYAPIVILFYTAVLVFVSVFGVRGWLRSSTKHMIPPVRAQEVKSTVVMKDGPHGENVPINYDETKAGSYTLPDALVLEDGMRVRNAATWFYLDSRQFAKASWGFYDSVVREYVCRMV